MTSACACGSLPANSTRSNSGRAFLRPREVEALVLRGLRGVVVRRIEDGEVRPRRARRAASRGRRRSGCGQLVVRRPRVDESVHRRRPAILSAALGLAPESQRPLAPDVQRRLEAHVVARLQKRPIGRCRGHLRLVLEDGAVARPRSARRVAWPRFSGGWSWLKSQRITTIVLVGSPAMEPAVGPQLPHETLAQSALRPKYASKMLC